MVKKLFWYVLFSVKLVSLVFLCVNWNFLWSSFLVVASTNTPSVLSMEGRLAIVNYFNSSFKWFLIFILIVIVLDIFFTVLKFSLLSNVKYLLKKPAKSFIFFHLSLVWFSVFSALILGWVVLLNFAAKTNLVLANLGAFRLGRPATTAEKNGIYQNVYLENLEKLFKDLDLKSDISISDFKSWKNLRLTEIKSELLDETFLRSYPAQEIHFKAKLQAKEDLQSYLQDVLIQQKQTALETFDKLQSSVFLNHVFVFIAVSCAITALIFLRKGQITTNDHRTAINSVEEAVKDFKLDLSNMSRKIGRLEIDVDSLLRQNGPAQDQLSLPTLPSPIVPPTSAIHSLVPQNLTIFNSSGGSVVDFNSRGIFFHNPLDSLQNRISVLEQKVAFLSAHKIECDNSFEFIAEIIQQIPFN